MIASLFHAALIVFLAIVMAASGGVALIAAFSLTLDRRSLKDSGLAPASCCALGGIGLVVFVLAAGHFAPAVMA